MEQLFTMVLGAMDAAFRDYAEAGSFRDGPRLPGEKKGVRNLIH